MSPPPPPPRAGGYYPYPPPFPFHLLEVTVISAQDLFPAVRSSMRSYAVAWIHPDHKLRTRLDPAGHTDPTWNDKFVFRVDDSTLRSDTSTVSVEIYAARSRLRPGSDTLIGTARAVLSTLRPSPATRFVALQVRRPASLRPQGILNLGVALLDAIVRSLPLYADLGAAPAFAYKDLIDKPRNFAAAAVGERGGGKEVGLVRSRSMKVVESKLETWRAELPPLKDEKDEEKGGAGRGRGRGRSQRTSRRMSCFSLAENP